MLKMENSDEYWKKKLTQGQYYILREKGTENPFSGKYWDHFKEGIYHCAGCDLPLFSSMNKYSSGCGWPSFNEVFNKDNVIEQKDDSYGMTRREIVCKKCGGHLGHIFDDGPEPTGLRYCINSDSLIFKKK